MRSVQVSKPKGPLEIVERDIPEPECYTSSYQGTSMRHMP